MCMIIIIFILPIGNRCHSIPFSIFCSNELMFYSQENDNALSFYLEFWPNIRSFVRSFVIRTFFPSNERKLHFFYERTFLLIAAVSYKLNKNIAANASIWDFDTRYLENSYRWGLKRSNSVFESPNFSSPIFHPKSERTLNKGKKFRCFTKYLKNYIKPCSV